MNENTVPNGQQDNAVDEIQLSDAPTYVHLTQDQKDLGATLPADKQYTVVTLKPAGDGHNASLLPAATKCYQMGASYEEALEHLSSLYDPSRQDHRSAPKRACDRVWGAGGDQSKLVDGSSERRPKADDSLLAKRPRLAASDVLAQSPETDPKSVQPLDILKTLFSPTDVINVQKTPIESGTLARLEDLQKINDAVGLDGFKFLNPATFKNIKGCINPNSPSGGISMRCNENVKKRNWMVLEFDPSDQKSKEEQLIESEQFNDFAMAMAKHAPLVMAVTTGGKSTHYWFNATGINKKIHKAFFNLACSHGADPRLAVKSQIARMPNVSAERESRGPQEMIYFNPLAGHDPSPGDWDAAGFEAEVGAKPTREIYYNGAKKDFIVQDNLGGWVSMDKNSARGMFVMSGVRGAQLEGEDMAPADMAVQSVMAEKNVQAVLSSASGREAGYYCENGVRFIVKNSPRFIAPRKGQFPVIRQFLESLLGNHPQQQDIFFGWMSTSIKQLRNDGEGQAQSAPAQMLNIVGEPNSGKSLLLQNILTPSFGGRTACADKLFRPLPSDFNAEMFGAELLYLDDSPVLKTDFANRTLFGERIKTHCVGVGGNYRGMYQDNIDLKPWWRIVRLMNTESMTLATFPPLDEGVEDKLIILKGRSMKKGSLSQAMETPGWFERLAAQIKTEMPAFIHFLLHEYELPEALQDPYNRYPVMSFKNPEILAEIDGGSPERFVRTLIRRCVSTLNPMVSDPEGNKFRAEFNGTVDKLYDKFAECGTLSQNKRYQSRLPSPQVLQSVLSNLERAGTSGIVYSANSDNHESMIDGESYWVIAPPSEHVPEPDPAEGLEDELL